MWIRTHSKIFQGLKREDIWRLWTDVNNWPEWHDDLEYCKLDGEFSTDEGLELANKLTVIGPLKWLWIKLVAQNVADTIPNEIEALVKIARGNNV